ncbi:hypothetical protein BIV23_31310 [Streptomyces monashensis]|uniref:Uncharacterized protein n=2 Tax=Streptomyces monashensis TaxID=1678012 RepID=A0A1S2PWT4_9ACTN|nr:hypothetical protein BIV23_31310 [Streptomyces monashensis]
MLYQVLRIVMVDAAESVPGTDPDRCGFTIALQAARDQVVTACDVITTTPGPAGTIGHRVLSGLLSLRRPRVSTRKVKSPVPLQRTLRRRQARDRRPVTGLDITVQVRRRTAAPADRLTR